MTWFRSFFDEDNVWQYFEVGDDGWAKRQVDLRADDAQALTAATLDEVLHLRDHADLAAMQRYERQFGVLAEASLDGWRDDPRAEEITQTEFEEVWTAARSALSGSG